MLVGRAQEVLSPTRAKFNRCQDLTPLESSPDTAISSRVLVVWPVWPEALVSIGFEKEPR